MWPLLFNPIHITPTMPFWLPKRLAKCSFLSSSTNYRTFAPFSHARVVKYSFEVLVIILPLSEWCRFPTFNDNLLIDSFIHLAIFHPLVCIYPSFVHVNFEEAHAAVVAAISTISAEAYPPSVAHPESWRVVFVFGEGTVFVCMVTVGDLVSD